MGIYQIWVLDPKQYDVWVSGAPYKANDNSYAKPLKEWALQEDADLCWNLAFFNLGTTQNIKNKVAYRTLQYVQKNNGEVLGYGTATSLVNLPSGSAFTGWKTAIKNGIVTSEVDKTNKRTRNMAGLTIDGRIIVVQTTSKLTEYTVANYVNSYIKRNYNTSIKILVVNDAGGSTGCYSTVSKILTAGEKEGYNGRAVVTVLCAKRKNIAPVNRVLQNGCKGDDVKHLQEILGGCIIDGSYGSGTKAQVKTAQKNLKLTADGICGPATQKALKLR